MAKLTWDGAGERKFETGVDHGVLYVMGDAGKYERGVAWNGLTAVTESPSGAESNKQYADNMVYLNLISAEEFGGTIEAFTSPPVPPRKEAPAHGLRVGLAVFHTKFGEGKVLALEGAGVDARAQVNFPRHGTKWLALAVAKLTIVE